MLIFLTIQTIYPTFEFDDLFTLFFHWPKRKLVSNLRNYLVAFLVLYASTPYDYTTGTVNCMNIRVQYGTIFWFMRSSISGWP